MRIDFVSDVVCPWCVIGLKALEAALDRTADVVTPDIHFQPFELNPGMPPEGQNIAGHILQKYGADPERSKATRDLIRTSAEPMASKCGRRPTAGSGTPSTRTGCSIGPAARAGRRN